MTLQEDIELTEDELVAARAAVPRHVKAGDASRLRATQKRIVHLESRLAALRPGVPTGPPCPHCGRSPGPEKTRP